MRLFTNNTSKKFLPLVLASAVTAALTACGGGGGSDSAEIETPAPQPSVSKIDVPVDSVFAALLKGRVDHNAPEAQASDPEVGESQPTASAVTYYDATLVAQNTVTGEEFSFEWPMVVDEAGMAASQKTVTLDPATYNFTLSVIRADQQYIGMLAEYVISDTDEVRLPMELEPVIGETIVDIEAVMTPSQLSLEYPPEELVAIDEPTIGVVIDGEEHFFAVNKDTGIADVLLSIPGGEHSYDVRFYNGSILIGRSEVGEQTLDLSVEGTIFDIDIISLQADVTVETTEFNEPFFTFNIPQEVIDHIGDINMVNLNVRLVDGDAGSEPQDEQLIVQQRENGTYYAQHLFNNDLTLPVTAYLTFLDLTSGTPTEFSACDGTITIAATNTVGVCEVGIPEEYAFSGNLLATLSINVLDQNGEAQSGAEVFIDGVSAGITGSNFGTVGFLKKHEIAGVVRVSASKGELSDSEDVVSTALGINSITLVLDSIPDPLGKTCKAIKGTDPEAVSGLYELDVDGQGGVEPFTTFCDMETKGGGWTLVQNRQYQVPMETTYDLQGALSFTDMDNGSEAYEGAISDEAWLVLRQQSSELQVMSGTPVRYYYSTFDHMNRDAPEACIKWDEGSSSLLNTTLVHFEVSDCTVGGGDYNLLGLPELGHPGQHSAVYNINPNLLWIEGTGSYPTSFTSIYVR